MTIKSVKRCLVASGDMEACVSEEWRRGGGEEKEREIEVGGCAFV